jgi:hypothetical protein
MAAVLEQQVNPDALVVGPERRVDVRFRDEDLAAGPV